MLKVENVSKTFNPGTVNEKLALDNFSITINEGDFVTVIGGNGAGKSTLMNAIAGVWKVDEGTITIDGENVTSLPEHKRAKYLGRVFQDPMLGTAATMEIQENLALAKRRGEHRTLKAGILCQDILLSYIQEVMIHLHHLFLYYLRRLSTRQPLHS